jgi:hypothetical protein
MGWNTPLTIPIVPFSHFKKLLWIIPISILFV